MRRSLAIVLCAGFLLAVLPGTVSAARSTRYHDHHVGFFCETAIDGGYAVASIDSSSASGDFAAANVWLDPAVPFESDPSINGSTDTVSVTTGTTETALECDLRCVRQRGNPLGTAVVQGTMTPLGDPQPINGTNHGKFHSRTTGTTQQFEAAATLTLPGQTIEFAGCTGDVTDVTVQESDTSLRREERGREHRLSLADSRRGRRLLCRPGSIRLHQLHIADHRGPDALRHGRVHGLVERDIPDRIDPTRRRDHR